MKETLAAEASAIQQAGTWKSEREIISKQGSNITVRKPNGEIIECINFCANNYLGLSGHPDVVKGTVDCVEKYGAGLSSARFICGTQEIHLELEQKIAKMHNAEDAILYAACFDANAGIFEVVLNKVSYHRYQIQRLMNIALGRCSYIR